MSNARSRVTAVALMVLAGVVMVAPAFSQDYPAKPIKLVAPSAPGTTSDIISRILAPSLSKNLGQAVIVENKAGADQMVAFEYVARGMPPDGYTLLSTSPTNQAMFPITVKNLRFDPVKELPPVIGLAETTQMFGSSNSLPWKSFAELLAHAKANPGKLNYGASTAALRLMTEVILRKNGLNVVYIPYGGGASYLQALVAGSDIHMGFMTQATAIGLADKFKVLAVTGSRRNPHLPEVPTLGELGLPNMPGIAFSLSVRSGTPPPIFQRIHAAASQVLQQADVRSLLEKNNFSILNQDPQTAARSLAEHAAFFAEVARQVGIQPE